jgi:hypothetical protein
MGLRHVRCHDLQPMGCQHNFCINTTAWRAPPTPKVDVGRCSLKSMLLRRTLGFTGLTLC